MLGHVPELVAGLKKMEDAQKPLSTSEQAAIERGEAPAFGPMDARVRIVEFSDFQCPYCARAADAVERIQRDYGSRVRFVFREFPLSAIHPNAREAAEAALSANAQGKFWPFHDRLFRNQGALDRAGLERQAKEAGLDLDAFKSSLDQHKFASQVDSDIRLGEEVSVDGTPTMFINGVRVPDPTDYRAIAQRIDALLRGDLPNPRIP
jgi:protein-disulfide isomerase